MWTPVPISLVIWGRGSPISLGMWGPGVPGTLVIWGPFSDLGTPRVCVLSILNSNGHVGPVGALASLSPNFGLAVSKFD